MERFINRILYTVYRLWHRGEVTEDCHVNAVLGHVLLLIAFVPYLLLACVAARRLCGTVVTADSFNALLVAAVVIPGMMNHIVAFQGDKYKAHFTRFAAQGSDAKWRTITALVYAGAIACVILSVMWWK